MGNIKKTYKPKLENQKKLLTYLKNQKDGRQQNK